MGRKKGLCKILHTNVCFLCKAFNQYLRVWKVWKSSRSVVSNPMDCRLPCSSIHGIFQARVLEWVAISFSRGSSRPRDRTRVSHIVGRHFTICATREVPVSERFLAKSSNHIFINNANILAKRYPWLSLSQPCMWKHCVCNPMDCSLPGASVHGVGCHSLLQGIFLTQGSNLCLRPTLQADWLPSELPGKPHSPGALSNPGIEPGSSALQVDSLLSYPPGKPHVNTNDSSNVQSLSRVQLFGIPWTAAPQASLSFTISQSLLKLISIRSVMPPNHLILCHALLLPSIFHSIRVFSNESALRFRWPGY